VKHSLWKSVNAAFAALALLGGLTACGGGGGDTNTEPTVVPVSTDTPTTAQPATVGTVGTVPRFAYVVNNNNNTTRNSVSIYTVDGITGQWHPHGYLDTGRSSGSVTVEPTGRFAYLTNTHEKSVSAYAINASNGALTKTGNDVPTSGAPRSITLHAKHPFAYVTSATASGGTISTYAINAVSGALTKVGDDVVTGDSPLPLVMDPSGQFAYSLTYYGHTLVAYAIDAQTGALKQVGDAIDLFLPTSVTVDPGGKFVYVLMDSNLVRTYAIDALTGALTLMNMSAKAGTESVVVTTSPSGKFVYVVNKSSDSVSAYSVDQETGILTKIGDVATGQQPVAVTVDAKGQFAYVAHGGDHTVSAYSIDADTGQLTHVGLVRTQFEPSAMAMVNGQAAVSVTPQFAYATNADAGTISAFAVDASSGALTKIGDHAAGTRPGLVATDPYGRFAYATDGSSNTITAYSIDGTGALHKLSEVDADDSGLRTPSAIVVDPSGRFVYASYGNSGGIQAYAMDPSTGQLSSAGLFATASATGNMVIDPIGMFLYAISSGAHEVSIWRIDLHTGSLTAVNGVAMATAPQGIAIDPSGRHFYVASGGTQLVIHAYDIDAFSGQLVAVSSTADAAPSAATGLPNLEVSSLAIDPSGRRAYVGVHSSDGHNVVSAYAIGATGTMNQMADVPFGSDSEGPGMVAIDPSGRFAYAVDATDQARSVTAFSINASTGALSRLGDFFASNGWQNSVVVTGKMQ
jgi:6-phosphogluconolactonase (cycloisomerase 2 family)